VTAAGVQTPPPGAARAQAAATPAVAGARLAWLYLASRRVPAAVGLLAALGGLLWVALRWQWNIAGGPAARQLIPLAIETGAAAVIAVTTYGPFGEPERAAGRWLPFLRLGTCLALAGAAAGALAAGSASAHLAGGSVGMLRDAAGFTGIALLTAALAGGALAWIGPVAYLGVTLPALTGHWTTPWIWPARPPDDRGAAICAALVFAAGVALIAVRGARDLVRD
jgi:hypothetical protein